MKPRARQVLPEPRSPASRIRSPGLAPSDNSAPSARVDASSGRKRVAVKGCIQKRGFAVSGSRSLADTARFHLGAPYRFTPGDRPVNGKTADDGGALVNLG